MKLYQIGYLCLLLLLFSCKKEKLADNNSSSTITYDFPTTSSTVTHNKEFLLLGEKLVSKVDAEGKLLWRRNNGYNANSALPLKNKQTLVCTDANSFVFVEIINNSGSSVRTFSLTTTGNERMTEPLATEFSTNELLFVGNGLNGIDSTLYVIKTNNMGDVLWKKKIKLSFNLTHIQKTVKTSNEEEIILAGYTGRIGGKNAMCFIKIDSSGTLLWENKKAFGIWENYPTDIHRINDNSFLITGYYDQSSTLDYNYQFCAYKISGMGDSVQLLTNGASKQDYCMSSIYLPLQDKLIMVGMEGRGRTSQDLNLASIKILTANTSLSAIISDELHAQVQACQALSAIQNNDGSLSIIGKKYAYENPNIVHTFFIKIKPEGSL